MSFVFFFITYQYIGTEKESQLPTDIALVLDFRPAIGFRNNRQAFAVKVSHSKIELLESFRRNQGMDWLLPMILTLNSFEVRLMNGPIGVCV